MVHEVSCRVLHAVTTKYAVASFCRNLGQNPSTIYLFTGHTGSKWNSVAQSSILSKKPGLLLSKIAHARTVASPKFN